LPSPQDAAVHPDLEEANRLPSSRIVGEISTVVGELDDLVARTGARELMVTSVAYDLAARIRSIELLAEHWTPRCRQACHPAFAPKLSRLLWPVRA
jgi:alkanesulfonate monooxygenase SsuD/methylene tetrahydromethanopterin reductase-like flavin-dependent oxidoreductase (luciferase family)